MNHLVQQDDSFYQPMDSRIQILFQSEVLWIRNMFREGLCNHDNDMTRRVRAVSNHNSESKTAGLNSNALKKCMHIYLLMSLLSNPVH